MTEFIDLAQCECLNSDPKFPVANIFNNDPSRFLQSNVDQELLISIQFRQSVKIHSIKFISSSESKNSSPKTIKLFANHAMMSLEEAEEAQATQGNPIESSTLKHKK